jgi:hypothetical protein
MESGSALQCARGHICPIGGHAQDLQVFTRKEEEDAGREEQESAHRELEDQYRSAISLLVEGEMQTVERYPEGQSLPAHRVHRGKRP